MSAAAKKKLAGMGLRRPGGRTPSDEEVRALEAKAEQIASKAPGTAPQTPQQQPQPSTRAASSKPARGKKTKGKKVQITAYLPRDVRDRLSRAAVALSGPPSHESVTSIVERAIRRELDRLAEEHGEFPETEVSPRPGRRPGR